MTCERESPDGGGAAGEPSHRKGARLQLHAARALSASREHRALRGPDQAGVGVLQQYYNRKGLLDPEKKHRKKAFYVLQEFYRGSVPRVSGDDPE